MVGGANMEGGNVGSSRQVEEHACMHAWQFVLGRKYKEILDMTMRGCSCKVEASKAVTYKTCQVRIDS
jgi:hypothetical protein